MTPAVFNLLLAIVGAFVFVGVTALPAVLQWPAPIRSGSRHPFFSAPRREAWS